MLTRIASKHTEYVPQRERVCVFEVLERKRKRKEIMEGVIKRRRRRRQTAIEGVIGGTK